ncbi:MAG: transposase [Acidimicrobiaceae bacterium]|nr:transposase [Acidimicrobiaceae bacterium]MDE0492453.1 transposase [Acidimicrobiaceae bacterium]
MFAAVGLLVGAFLAVVGTALASETTYLIDKAPTYIDDAEDWLNDTLGLSVEFNTVRDEFLEGSGAQDLFSRFADDLVNVGATVASPVETDAAWIGGRAKNMQALIRRQRVHGSNSHLTPVMGIRDRATGQIAAEAVARDDSATAQEFLSQTTPRVR